MTRINGPHANGRSADHAIDPQFLARATQRSFTDEAISEQALLGLLEAARWAPSAFNIQPWRFVYARRGTPAWAPLLGLLTEYNQRWVGHAAALVFLISDSFDRRKPDMAPTPSYSHSFDAGAAWAYLTLQAHKTGWTANCMTGFHVAEAYTVLGVPEGHRVDAAIAIGRPIAPDETQKPPSGRRPIAELAFEGRFRA